jgi:hypothetical protein
MAETTGGGLPAGWVAALTAGRTLVGGLTTWILYRLECWDRYGCWHADLRCQHMLPLAGYQTSR